MEDRRRLPVGGSGITKHRASSVKTEHEAEAHQAREGEQLARPIRVKREDISEVPLKVPRFQYVDFPSLHQCIQQLTVPPLDNWLANCPLGRSSGRAPVSPKERVPKFKYVDFPSLHHCIKQLSVPPIESWSSGLAWPERGNGERDGRGSDSQSSSVRGNRPGPDMQAPTCKQEKYTAFQFPEPDPGPVQCVSTSNQASGKPRLPVHLSRSPKASNTEEALKNTMVGSGRQCKQPTDQTPCFSEMKHERGTESLTKSNKMSAVDGVVAEVHQEKESLKTLPQQTATELADSGPGEQFWRAIPESVCPLCQKVCSDSEQLRIHQRSHLEKRPH